MSSSEPDVAPASQPGALSSPTSPSSSTCPSSSSSSCSSQSLASPAVEVPKKKGRPSSLRRFVSGMRRKKKPTAASSPPSNPTHSSVSSSSSSSSSSCNFYDGRSNGTSSLGHPERQIKAAGSIALAPSAVDPQSMAKFFYAPLPFSVPTISHDKTTGNPRLGIGLLEWSSDGTYCCARNDNMPRVLWVWRVSTNRLIAVLVQKAPVRCAAWHPREPLLALCTGSDKIYTWCPRTTDIIHVPFAGFMVRRLVWQPTGQCLVLVDKSR